MANHMIFIYGTLKRGQPNEKFMTELGKVTFQGEAQTVKKFPLVITTQWNLPVLLNVEGKGQIVRGEVYEVDDEALRKLDEFEEHPDFYLRTRVQVALTKAQGEERKTTVIDCWTYFFTECKPDYLELRFFDSYDSKGDHGLEYDTTELEK